MRQWFGSHLTYANVISTLALFLVIGGGTTLAATGGNFILGQSNTASSTTALTRTAPNTGASKGLQVTNTGTGAGATALGLNVATGHAPFTVNSGTKVANLNADKLDGQDSTGFIRGRKMDLNLAEGPRVNPSVTKIATVGPYDISGSCIDNDDGYTEVRIHVKGPAGVTEAVYSAVANDTTDLGNYSRTETLSANVDKVVLQWERASGFTRIGGTLNIRSSSGAIVTLDFIGLTWPAGGVSGLCAIRGTATMGT